MTAPVPPRLDRGRLATPLLVLGAVAALVVGLDAAAPEGGLKISSSVVVIGLFLGLTYSLLAVGLVLVYRATGVINFAYGEIGALGAVLIAKLTYDGGVPFVLSLVVVVALGGLLGAVIEYTVVRRLFNAPRLVLLVATLGIAQLMLYLQTKIPRVEGGSLFPTALDRQAEVAGVIIRPQDFLVLAVVPAVVLGLTIFLSRTPYGTAIRASAENPDAARLAGISVKKVSTLVWVISGALAVLTASLNAPVVGEFIGSTVEGGALGPSLLLRALAAAMIGRFVSLPLTFAGGLAVGVAEAVMNANFSSSAAPPTNLVFFLVIVGLLLLQARRGGLTGETGSFSLTPQVAAIPERLKGLWWVRRLRLVVAAGGLTVGLLVPVVFSSSAQLDPLTRVLILAIVALSVTVLTGWGGQLSLGQFAFVGFGAYMTGALNLRGVPFGVALLYAVVAGVVLALVIGFPALRIRGLFLAIVTLAFAVAAQGWLFRLPVLQGTESGGVVRVGTLLGVDLGTARAYYLLCLAVLVVVAVLIGRLRRTGIGRQLIAVRENERSTAAYTVAAARAKLVAFALSGGIAALGGGLLGGLLGRFGTINFTPAESLQVIAISVIGGLGSVAGAVLGPAYVVGLPQLFGDNDVTRLATSGVGLLIFLLYYPRGLAGIALSGRDALLRLAERRLPPAPAPVRSGEVPRLLLRQPTAPLREATVPALECRDITVRFGGRLALDAVSVKAMPGETVGLIGSNGAGKSTLMNVVSGFVPATGAVLVDGTDVSALPPHERARAGLGRAFQDARLFGDLTVRESVMVALEAREPSELMPSLLALPPSWRMEARKRRQADELIDFLGLGRYADAFVSTLSTGTRRIVELACLLALDSRVLLLDEPTAGVAQKETEAFGPLIRRIQSELSATVVIIEHDIPLILSMSDRVYCLGAGSVIAEGLPEQVRNDPAVVAAYLGTDERAIARSGAAATRSRGRKQSSTSRAKELSA